MEQLCVENTHTPSQKNDKRRRTMEVSATMLRDILIGSSGKDMKNDLSLDEGRINHEMIQNINPHDRRNKSNTRTEGNSGKSQNEKKSTNTQNVHSSTNTSTKLGVACKMDKACSSNGLPTSPRQNSEDSVHFKIGHRYSPRQGSTGSGVSNKSQSEDSVGSEESTTSPNTCEEFSETNLNESQNSILKAVLPHKLPTDSSIDMSYPIQTSSPLQERKNPRPTVGLKMKKAPYYVGDTCLNSSKSSTTSNQDEISQRRGSNSRQQGKFSHSSSSCSEEIPYQEVFAQLSRQIIYDPEMMSTAQFSPLQAYNEQCCSQAHPSVDEHELYDESMYRLLPASELARACPNPLYRPEEVAAYMASQMQYCNVEGFKKNANAVYPEQPYDMNMQVVSQAIHQPRPVTNFPYEYENYNFENHLGKDDNETGSATFNDNKAINESRKLNRDNFQQRIRAYHPTQMQINHRARNESFEDEGQHFDPGK